jgi:hypothetical protein
MTVRLDWPDEVVDRLTEEARRDGLPLNEYLLKRLQAGTGTSLSEMNEPERRRQAVQSMLEHRKGNFLGSDVTIRELIEEGRRF